MTTLQIVALPKNIAGGCVDAGRAIAAEVCVKTARLDRRRRRRVAIHIVPQRLRRITVEQLLVVDDFASRLMMTDADLRTVAELLRDKTLAMVMRYAHLAPDYKLAAVERTGASFIPDSTKLTPTFHAETTEPPSVQ